MTFESAPFDSALRLAVALALGLLVGAERGWKSRELGEGRRVAGLRTFGLTGLLGGVAGLLANDLGPLSIGLVFIGLAMLLAVAYARTTPLEPDANISITTLVALLLTFALGALATHFDMALAAAAAVVATLLLDLKATLHGWLAKVEERELSALLRLLLISVVVLPFLPNGNFGPWQALNPYVLWWMVVLISAISFCGYVAVKLLGQRWGVALTALLSGLVSSTALTLHFSRLARHQPGNGSLLAGGILFSCAAMPPRLLVVALVLHPDLARALLLPFAAMEILILLPALYWWHQANHDHVLDTGHLNNPLELKAALGFGVLLSMVMLATTAARQLVSDEALLAVALISGIADVDAITASLSHLSLSAVSTATALTGIVLAAASNNLSKSTMAVLIGGKAIGWRVAVPLTVSAAAAVALLPVWR